MIAAAREPLHRPAPPADAGALDYEVKYAIPPQRAAAALACLRALLRPDPVHPVNSVVSIYFDTRGLDYLWEKFEGHLCKTKVRVRWYEEPGTARRSAAAFVEVKHRIGSRRRKLRAPAGRTGDRLAALPLSDPSLRALPALLHGAEFTPPADLQPWLVVSYRRHRFVDPGTGSRLCLDTDIRVPRTNRRWLPSPRPVALDLAVCEVKNRSGDLPRSLRPLLGLGSRLASFSKYGASMQVALAGGSGFRT